MTPILLMGIAHGSVAGTVWNSIMYLTPRKKIGTIVGVMAATSNICHLITPMFFGVL